MWKRTSIFVSLCFVGLCFGGPGEIRTHDLFHAMEARGFAICGDDKVWHWAKGKIVGKEQVEVWSDDVAKPVAIRYGWADNPVLNLFSNDGLPVTPFRTDDFKMSTEAKPAPVR